MLFQFVNTDYDSQSRTPLPRAAAWPSFCDSGFVLACSASSTLLMVGWSSASPGNQRSLDSPRAPNSCCDCARSEQAHLVLVSVAIFGSNASG